MPCKTVLVVEDDRDIRESLVALIQMEGYSTYGVNDGKKALEALKDIKSTCLILLDLMMPVMDGWQFLDAREGDADLARIPVVTISAVDESSRPKGRAQGHIKKPIDFDALIATIQGFCGKGRT